MLAAETQAYAALRIAAVQQSASATARALKSATES
jgi:hypothetical protein